MVLQREVYSFVGKTGYQPIETRVQQVQLMLVQALQANT